MKNKLTPNLINALNLYKPPFVYNFGYIHDSNNEMVCDETGRGIDLDERQDHITQIRGWGRIQYLSNPEELQDGVGELVVMALNEFWEKHKSELI